jgi:hypothetical protein
MALYLKRLLSSKVLNKNNQPKMKKRHPIWSDAFSTNVFLDIKNPVFAGMRLLS